jgi:IS1 family transposase
MTGVAPPLGEIEPMAHVLSAQERHTVIHDLCEGASINSIVRKHGVAQTTILRLLVRVGQGCRRLHSRLFRGLSCHLLQCDEIWSYVGVKEAGLRPDHPEGWGEAYTFVALDVASRSVISYEVGKRGEEATSAFIADLRARLVTVSQVTTDGSRPTSRRLAARLVGSSITHRPSRTTRAEGAATIIAMSRRAVRS